MKMLIDKSELKYLLEKKRDVIGYAGDIVGVIVALITIATVPFTDYSCMGDTLNSVSKIVVVVLGVILVVLSTIPIVKKQKNKYNHIDLLNDIVKLDETEHYFSLVAIKDTFNEYPARFLLQYRKKWDCFMFFSYHTAENDSEDVRKIKHKLSIDLNIPESDIVLNAKASIVHRKLSADRTKEKTYSHKLYQCELNCFPNNLKKDTFEINGIVYKWMTIREMLDDQNIRSKNKEVINFVDDNID